MLQICQVLSREGLPALYDLKGLLLAALATAAATHHRVAAAARRLRSACCAACRVKAPMKASREGAAPRRRSRPTDLTTH